MTLEVLAHEKVWLDKCNYADAERVYYEKQTKILKYENFGKYINYQVKSLNNTNCEDCAICNIIAKIDSQSDISKLLDKVQQWDETNSTIYFNNYRKINKFECLVCCFKTLKFNDWKCHIMSLTHRADCHRTTNLYSYICFDKICKLLLYGSKESLIKHNMDKHSYNINDFSISSLMAEVMKRYLANDVKPLYFSSHCKKFAETPIHTDYKLLKKELAIPIEYYCSFCKVTFVSSQEIIDYHLLSVEHMTLKCFDKLCSEANINPKQITLSKDPSKNDENSLSADDQSVLITTFEKYINYQVKSLNNTNCEDCAMCNVIAEIDSQSDISKLLDKVQQWDRTNSTIYSNQYQKINKFECLVCCYKTLKFNDWKCHIMSLNHRADCHRTNNLYSFICFNKICKLLLYGPKESLIKHNMDNHGCDINCFGISLLMAEVMKRNLANNLKPLYFCSHCKKFAETPIHTDYKLFKKGLAIPIEYYCSFCKVTFVSSQEMIDYHLLSVEHMTLKCFDELCSEAKINSEQINLSDESNEDNVNNLSADDQSVLISTFGKYINYKGRLLNNTHCKDCSMCNIIAQIDLKSDISKLLNKVQQRDKTNSTIYSNQYQKIDKFECLVCCYKTLKFNDWKCHIMSLNHRADCHRTNNLYSFICFNKICKLLLYGPKESLIKHNMDNHGCDIDCFGISLLMAEVMKRYLANNLKPLYFCSHCKKFAETPIHTDYKLFKKGLAIPIEYYCSFCKVTFVSSQEMIDYHLLSVEHMTLKCFDELCSEAKINSEQIKLSDESNKDNEYNLSEDVLNILTTNSVKLPYIILTRFININEYCGLCKLCNTSLIWNSKIIVSHLLECKYTYVLTDSNKTTVKTFDCNVCNNSTNCMNQHKLHIMSHSHLTNCYDTSNYYSYFCDVCNRYMYSYRLVILNHIRVCHEDIKTTEFPMFSIFMANVFNELNTNANRVEFIYYHSANKPIEVLKTDPFQCNACKIIFDAITDYNWHLITSEHIILSFATPKNMKKSEKIKKLSTTNIPTRKSSLKQNVPVSQKYDDIESKYTQNEQLNKSLNNLDVDGRTHLPSIKKVQKSLVNNNVLEKLNDDVQKGSNKSIEHAKLTPNHSKHRQQYSNYFKHKMILLKKLRQYDDLVMKTLSYYCDACDFMAVEKYVWDRHNQKEHHSVDRSITYCSTCLMFVGGNEQEHNRTKEHSSLLIFLQSFKSVEVSECREKTSSVKLIKGWSSDTNCKNLEQKEENELNNTDCFKESKYSNDTYNKNSDCSLMEEPSKNREDPMDMKDTIFLLDTTKCRYEHKQDETNTCNAVKLTHSEIAASSNNVVNTLIAIPYQANVLVEKTTENINVVNVSTDDLVLNQVENESNEVISNFDETPWPPLTNSTQIFENKKKSGLDEDQLYGEYVIQRLKNIKNTTVKQLVKLEIDYIFYNKMKQLLQENTK